MKSDKELVLEYRDKLNGMIADAASRQARGAELALLLRQWFRDVDAHLLALIHEARKPDPPPPAAQPKEKNDDKAQQRSTNGHAAQGKQGAAPARP